MEAAFRTIIFLTVVAGAADPRLVLYRNFVQPEAESPIVLEGSRILLSRGLRINPDSRIRFGSFEGGSIRNAAAEVDFMSPTFIPDRMPILAGIDRTCRCALKLHMGRTILIVSDRYITLGRLDEQHTGLARTYKQIPYEFPPRAEERTVRLEVHDGFARVLVEDTVLLESAVQADDFDYVDIQTYARAFTIAAFKLTEYVKDTLYVNVEKRYLEAAAVYTPAHFNTGSLREHHLVGWKHSPAAPHSLFQTFISPASLDKALTELGAIPGKPLPWKSWTARYDPTRPEPELTAEGSRIEITVEFRDSIFQVDDILQTDSGVQPHRFRFGAGHINHNTWKSGCAVCLLSCPAGIIGSESFSVREWMRHPRRHKISPALPFGEDDIVTLRFTIKESPEHISGMEHGTTFDKCKTIQSGGKS